jgi:uncharacterized protein (DUF1778 family)
MNKDKIIVIRITEQEKEILKTKAKEKNLSLSQFLIKKSLES